jgi:hypothetical protein
MREIMTALRPLQAVLGAGNANPYSTRCPRNCATAATSVLGRASLERASCGDDSDGHYKDAGGGHPPRPGGEAEVGATDVLRRYLRRIYTREWRSE